MTSIPYWKQKFLVIPPNLKIIHHNDYSAEKYKDYYDELYFRLFHNLKDINNSISNDVEFVDNTYETVEEFVTLINKSYTDLSVTSKQLESWRTTLVYNSSLWVLLREKHTGTIIGSGIGDFDKEASELILEWIQVLPNYRKRGYGQIIVNHILAKMKNIAKFATVSGKINNSCNPERMYRKCGFVGNDVWHILSKELD